MSAVKKQPEQKALSHRKTLLAWDGTKSVRMTLVRGTAGKNIRHLQNLIGLGLRKRGDTVVHKNTAAIGGMVSRVAHLIEVKDV